MGDCVDGLFHCPGHRVASLLSPTPICHDLAIYSRFAPRPSHLLPTFPFTHYLLTALPFTHIYSRPSHLLTTLPNCSDLAHDLLTTFPFTPDLPIAPFTHDLALYSRFTPDLAIAPICSRPCPLLTICSRPSHLLLFAHDLALYSLFAHDLAFCSRPCHLLTIYSRPSLCSRPSHLLTTCPFTPICSYLLTTLPFAHDLLLPCPFAHDLLTTLPFTPIYSYLALYSRFTHDLALLLLFTHDLPICSDLAQLLLFSRDARYPTSQFSDPIRLRDFPYLILRLTVSFFRYLDYIKTNKYCTVLGELMLTSSLPKRGIRNKRYLIYSLLISFRLSLSCSSAL